MSALAAYVSAQADEMRQRGFTDAAQADLVRKQSANYDDESTAKQAEQYGMANQANASAKLTDVNASLAPDEAAARNAVNTAQAGLFGANRSVALSRLPFEMTNLGLDNQYKTTQGLYQPLQYQSDLATQALQRQVDAQRNLSVADPSRYAAAVPGAGAPATNTLASPQAGWKFDPMTGNRYKFDPTTGQAITDQPMQGKAKGGIVGRASDDAPPGKGDTVPTMLQPGEAVLNKHAVDHYGPDVVDAMNRMGMLRGKAIDELTKMAKGVKAKPKKKAA